MLSLALQVPARSQSSFAFFSLAGHSPGVGQKYGSLDLASGFGVGRCFSGSTFNGWMMLVGR